MEPTKQKDLLSDGRQLDAYLAAGIMEGFEEHDTNEDYLKAASFVGRNRLYLHLQGFFGRQLKSLVQNGYLDSNFDILHVPD